MEFQHSFCALSLTLSSAAIPSCVSYGYDTFLEGGLDIDRKCKETLAVKQAGFPSIMVHSDYPFRICEASDSFADILGFKPKELQGGSLRLLFGPETDLQKLKKIVSDQCQDDNDRLVLYRRDGDEIACSIHSTASDLRSGERVSTLFILNYRSAQSSPLPVNAAVKQARHEGRLIQSAMSSFIPPIETMTPIQHDPALIVHLSAIRRCRRSGRA